MIISNELANLTILVSFLEGNERSHQIVPFRVYREERQFKAIPLINSDERKKTRLPQEILFSFDHQGLTIEQGISEETLDVVKRILQELKMQRVV